MQHGPSAICRDKILIKTRLIFRYSAQTESTMQYSSIRMISELVQYNKDIFAHDFPSHRCKDKCQKHSVGDFRLKQDTFIEILYGHRSVCRDSVLIKEQFVEILCRSRDICSYMCNTPFFHKLHLRELYKPTGITLL